MRPEPAWSPIPLYLLLPSLPHPLSSHSCLSGFYSQRKCQPSAFASVPLRILGNIAQVIYCVFCFFTFVYCLSPILVCKLLGAGVCVYVFACHIHTYCNFFIHLSTDGHLGCFHMLTIVNNAAVNMVVQISVLAGVFIFFG